MAYKKKLTSAQKKALDEYKASLKKRQGTLDIPENARHSHVDVHVSKSTKKPIKREPNEKHVKELGLKTFWLGQKKCTVIERRDNGNYLYFWEKGTEEGNSDCSFPIRLSHPYLGFRVIAGESFLERHSNAEEVKTENGVYAVRDNVIWYKDYLYLNTKNRINTVVSGKILEKIKIII